MSGNYVVINAPGLIVKEKGTLRKPAQFYKSLRVYADSVAPDLPVHSSHQIKVVTLRLQYCILKKYK